VVPIQMFLSQEILEDLEAALEQVRVIAVYLGAELQPGRDQK